MVSMIVYYTKKTQALNNWWIIQSINPMFQLNHQELQWKELMFVHLNKKRLQVCFFPLMPLNADYFLWDTINKWSRNEWKCQGLVYNETIV